MIIKRLEIMLPQVEELKSVAQLVATKSVIWAQNLYFFVSSIYNI